MVNDQTKENWGLTQKRKKKILKRERKLGFSKLEFSDEWPHHIQLGFSRVEFASDCKNVLLDLIYENRCVSSRVKNVRLRTLDVLRRVRPSFLFV